MKRILLFLVLILVANVQAADQPGLYITISGANVKRAKLAWGKLHPLPNSPVAEAQLLKDVEAQIRWDLDFANLFDLVPPATFTELDKVKDFYQMRYEDWSAKGVSFVLKTGYRVEAGKLTLEALLYDIPGQKKLFGTRYQFPSNQYQKVVHAMAEDVLKQLTGEKGLFNTRVVMVCKDSRKSSNKEVYVVDMDGKNPTSLTHDNTLTLSPYWSPDSKFVTYTQFGTISGAKRGTLVRLHNIENGERKVLTAREGMNSGGVWSPKGDRLAVTLSFNGRPEIYFMGPSGGEPEPFSRNVQVRRVTGEGFQPSYSSLLFDVEPSWSPDGQKIVFSSARSGHPMIYVADVSSKIASQLTFAGTYNATPNWSPKGDKILFSAQRLAEGNFDIYIIDPDGNNLNRITNGDRSGRRRVNSENASWAPTGRHFAFANNEGGAYSVYVMTTDGTFKKKISPEKKECSEPAWAMAPQ